MLRRQQGVEDARIVALSHDRAELAKDVERGTTGQLPGRLDADRSEVVGNAFADVGEILESAPGRWRFRCHEG